MALTYRHERQLPQIGGEGVAVIGVVDERIPYGVSCLLRWRIEYDSRARMSREDLGTLDQQRERHGCLIAKERRRGDSLQERHASWECHVAVGSHHDVEASQQMRDVALGVWKVRQHLVDALIKVEKVDIDHIAWSQGKSNNQQQLVGKPVW